MQSLLAEMDTNILRLLREELSAYFSALLRLLLVVLGKSPSCSSCIYTVRLTAGSAYCWRCLKMFCLGNSALLYLCLWCKMSSLRPADSLSVQNIGKKKKLGLCQDTSQAFLQEVQPDPECTLSEEQL